MKITPLEIRQKTFEKSLRGYNKEEVAAYLNSLSLVWDRMLDEQEQLKARLEEAREEVKKLKEVETTLFKTLRTAEETGASMVEQAQKTAQLSIQEAEMKARQLMEGAQKEAERLVKNAEQNAREIMDTMEEEVRRMDEVSRQMKHQSLDFVGDFKNTIGSLLSKIDALELRAEEIDSSGIVTEARQVARSVREQKAQIAAPDPLGQEAKGGEEEEEMLPPQVANRVYQLDEEEGATEQENTPSEEKDSTKSFFDEL